MLAAMMNCGLHFLLLGTLQRVPVNAIWDRFFQSDLIRALGQAGRKSFAVCSWHHPVVQGWNCSAPVIMRGELQHNVLQVALDTAAWQPACPALQLQLTAYFLSVPCKRGASISLLAESEQAADIRYIC